jgi:hypothetical protein
MGLDLFDIVFITNIMMGENNSPCFFLSSKRVLKIVQLHLIQRVSKNPRIQHNHGNSGEKHF